MKKFQKFSEYINKFFTTIAYIYLLVAALLYLRSLSCISDTGQGSLSTIIVLFLILFLAGLFGFFTKDFNYKKTGLSFIRRFLGLIIGVILSAIIIDLGMSLQNKICGKTLDVVNSVYFYGLLLIANSYLFSLNFADKYILKISNKN